MPSKPFMPFTERRRPELTRYLKRRLAMVTVFFTKPIRLRPSLVISALSVLVFNSACVSSGAKTDFKKIEASEFVDYGITPLEHTIYLGSDSDLHFFAWSYGKLGGYWSVDKKAMPFKCEKTFPSNTMMFVIKDEKGNWQPHVSCP